MIRKLGISLLVLFLFSACQPPPKISQDKAIELATRSCKALPLALIGEPQNIRTRLMTLQEADRWLRADVHASYRQPLDTRVWIVQMDGQLQLVGGPPTAVTTANPWSTPPPSWGTCSVGIDANTGDFIFAR